MLGTGTQIDPFRPLNWVEFIEAVGTYDAYVECPESEEWDMIEVLPGGKLTEPLKMVSREIKGNGLIIKNLRFSENGRIDLNKVGYIDGIGLKDNPTEQNIFKLIFLNFSNDADLRGGFDGKYAPILNASGNATAEYFLNFKNCKFIGNINPLNDISGVTVFMHSDKILSENLTTIRFTDDGDKGCYLNLAFNSPAMLTNNGSALNVEFINCHCEFTNLRSGAMQSFKKCYIRGSFADNESLSVSYFDDCVIDVFVPEGAGIQGTSYGAVGGGSPYRCVVNTSKVDGRLTFPEYNIGTTPNLKNPKTVSDAGVTAASPINSNTYTVTLKSTPTSGEYKQYLPAKKEDGYSDYVNRIDNYTFTTRYIGIPITSGKIKFKRTVGSNYKNYACDIVAFTEIGGEEIVVATGIYQESSSGVEFDLPAGAKYVKVISKNADGSELTTYSVPVAATLQFIGDELYADTWRVTPGINYGAVYHLLLPDLYVGALPSRYKQNYITIYDSLSPVETFETHGLAVLSPTKCEITEEYQGKWTITLEHPRDVDGKHKYIKPFNIIKAMGQLFSIISVSNKIPGIITAKAEHIFYHLNDRWIFPGARIISTSVSGLMLSAKLASSDFSTENQISYDFSFMSDIVDLGLGVKSNAKWGYTQEGMSLAEFVLGAGNLLDMSGGELYRDNFYYSIYTRMENSNDNAFEIRVGKDLTGIKRIVDVSQMCTYFRVYNGLDSSHGTWFAVSYTNAVVDAVAPHSIIRSKTFNPQIPFWITDEDAIAIAADELVAEEGMRFFRENATPDIRYEITLEDINGNPDFAEFKNLPDYRVGNIGTIYDERLGVQATLKITKTVKDAITGKTISVVFGELVGETTIVENVKALKTSDGEVLYTADGELLQTRE